MASKLGLRGTTSPIHTALRTTSLLSPFLRPTASASAICHSYAGVLATLRPHASKSHPPDLLPRPDDSSPLAHQRLSRPVAPHLGIYKWQITSVLSISTRLTGLLLSGLFYAFGAAYLVVPWLGLGWDLSSAGIVAAVHGWPGWVKGGLRMW